MAQNRRREQYGYDEGSWGEEDRRYRSGRYDDWQRRNDDMRRREWGQGRDRSYGRGFEDYGSGRDMYGSGGDREVDAEMGRGWGQGSYGQGSYGQGQQRDYGQGQHSSRSRGQDYGQGGQYGYGHSGSSGIGSGQQFGYGAEGWRGSGSQGWDRGRQGGWSSSGSQYGGYDSQSRGYGSGQYGGGQGQYGSQGYGEQRGMWDRATDEVASWFGDDDAQRRREMDQHRGKGPKNYTRSDERIKEEVCDNLAEHPMIDASEIEVKVQSGEVTLDGTVHSRQQKRAAEDCVERISGIKHLQNNLRIQDTQSGAMGGMTGAMGQTGQSSGMSGYGSSGSSTLTGSSGRSTTSGLPSGSSSTGSTEKK